MLYDLEERTEDAFVALLRAGLPGEMRVYPAWTDEAIQYPCAVVHAGTSDAVSEQAEWHSSRQIAVEISVMTEAVAVKNGAGSVMITSRERNAEARSAVLTVLSTASLLTDAIAAAGPGVAFSMAQLGGPVVRSVNDRIFVTIIPVDVIANPVEVA